MNLGDPELEFIDPTPNVHTLFIQFDKIFFDTRLASRAVVRWSKRMYSCAGVCSYEGRAGLCNIALSEPLLKLRPRKDLIETLLHEMIHAYLFITCRDQDRDGHGPNFKFHMHRINNSAGLNISIYHDFHDEVELYQTHWWRCNGPCQTRKPHFGIVRKPVNRAPSPFDYWFEDHRRKCGGTFVKIKEPEKQGKKNQVSKPKPNQNVITKYIKNNIQTINNNVPKSVLKDSNNIPTKTGTAKNSSNTVVITKKGPIFNPQVNKPPVLFTGTGYTVETGRVRSNSVDVTETVRNIWANKEIGSTGANKRPDPPKTITQIRKTIGTNLVTNPNKHKGEFHGDSPPAKVKKINDYFKTTASSVLKDIYGEDFKVTQLNDSKLFAVTNKVDVNFVGCPICNTKVSDKEINRHLDECLNKEVIETLSKDSGVTNPALMTNQDIDRKKLKDFVGVLPSIPPFRGNCGDKKENDIKSVQRIPVSSSNLIDLTNIDYLYSKIKTDEAEPIENDIKPVQRIPVFSSHSIDLTNIDYLNTRIKTEEAKPIETLLTFDSNDINKVKSIVKKINYDKHVRKSDNFVVPKETAREADFGFLPSFLDDVACKIEAPPIKIEPGTSKDIISQLTGQKCACCGEKVDKPIEQHLDECLAFFDNNTTIPEPGTSKDKVSQLTGQKCACCGDKVDKPIEQHLDECLAFFDNNTTIPEEGPSTSFANQTIVIDDDDDDVFDESQMFNATGTKCPCPCCLQMIEQADMNDHLDSCLS